MSIAAIITLSITIAGFIGGVIAALVKLGGIMQAGLFYRSRILKRLSPNIST